jgi:NAD+ kinase
MLFAVFGRYFKDERFTEIQQFFTHLEEKKLNYIVYEKYYADCIKNGVKIAVKPTVFDSYEDFSRHPVDVVVSIGGDGTLLNTLQFIRSSGIPVVGINTGRLGFLAGIPASESGKMLDDVVKGPKTGEQSRPVRGSELCVE